MNQDTILPVVVSPPLLVILSAHLSGRRIAPPLKPVLSKVEGVSCAWQSLLQALLYCHSERPTCRGEESQGRR